MLNGNIFRQAKELLDASTEKIERPQSKSERVATNRRGAGQRRELGAIGLKVQAERLL